jgi:alkylated DNA repair dioxygenase AlkB
LPQHVLSSFACSLVARRFTALRQLTTRNRETGYLLRDIATGLLRLHIRRMQLSLFGGAAAHTLVDDERGVISYHPNAVSTAAAATWFAALRDGVEWRSERRLMYDREVDVPRLVASFALEDPDIPGELHAATEVARRLAGCQFNSVGLNFYRDERDSVAPHNDKLHELTAGAPIALLSLGATRVMTIRTKATPRRSIQLELEPGSVLLMTYATQQHFDHGIPKSTSAVGPRISAAFRQRPRTG